MNFWNGPFICTQGELRGSKWDAKTSKAQCELSKYQCLSSLIPPFCYTTKTPALLWRFDRILKEGLTSPRSGEKQRIVISPADGPADISTQYPDGQIVGFAFKRRVASHIRQYRVSQKELRLLNVPKSWKCNFHVTPDVQLLVGWSVIISGSLFFYHFMSTSE